MIIRLWREHGLTSLLVLILVLGVVGQWNIVRQIGRPFGGYLSFYNGIANHWDITRLTPPWWSSFTRGEMRLGDELVSLDGQPNHFFWNEPAIYETAYQAGRSQVEAVVLRQGKILRLQLPIVIFSLNHYWDTKLPDLLNGLGFWLLAWVVYRARPQETVNRAFAISAMSVAYSLWHTRPALFPFSDMPDSWLFILYSGIMGPVTSASFMYMAWHFPTTIRRGKRIFLPLLWLTTGVLVMIYTASAVLLEISGPSSVSTEFNRWGFYGFVYLGAIGIFFLIVRLLRVLIDRQVSLRQRRQAQLSLLGMSIACTYAFPMWYQMAFGGVWDHFWRGLDLRALSLAIPLAVGVAILRYQTFRQPHAFILVVPILGVSSLLGSLAATVWQSTAERLILTPFVITIGVALCASLIWSSQVRWRGFFGRILHWDQRSYDAVRRFGQSLVGETNLHQLPSFITLALVKELELEQAAIWLYEEGDRQFHLAGKSGSWSNALPTTFAIDPAILTTVITFIHLNHPDSIIPASLASLLAPTETLVILRSAGKEIGLLALGKRWDEEVADERDSLIIDLIGQQAALFLLSARQIDEIRRIPRLVDEAQEQERTKISQELHDTIQQILGRLPFYLEISRIDAKQSEEMVQQSITEIEEAARILRQIRHDLTTSQVESGLIKPLQNLIERFKKRTGLNVHLSLDYTVDDQLSVPTRHALYRVIQQAMDNAAAHAEACTLAVSLTCDGDRICFLIADDGRGFSEEERQQAQSKGSFGLKFMAARIHNVEGYFSLISSPGHGTEVRGWVPKTVNVTSESL